MQHGRDASAAGDHADALAHVGRVDHGALGALDAHGVADLELRDVLADVALRVGFDHEVEVAWVLFVGGDGRVAADNLFAVDYGGERHVLADGEADDVGGVGQAEAVDGDVVGGRGLLRQGEVLVDIGFEDLASRDGACVCGWLACCTVLGAGFSLLIDVKTLNPPTAAANRTA